jgi:serine/threonine protein phosphatase 1
MRELVIGDIHGCIRAFQKLLEVVAPQESDTLIFLGDYVDRGPDSCGVIETIIELQKKCNVVTIRGNHEQMLLQALEDREAYKAWCMYGGREAMESYAKRGHGWGPQALPKPHDTFLRDQLLDYWETDRHIFIHASLDPELDMKDQPDRLLRWEPFRNPTRHKSGKQIICGHTSQKTGIPALFDGGLCIDTYIYGGGWLTCYDTGAQTFIQTNERGEQRKFDLEQLKKCR